jgi:hypothetical protein
LLSAELPTKGPGNVDEATALFSTAPSFIKFSRAGVFGVPAFAFLAVPSVQRDCHLEPDSFQHRCTPLHAKKGIFFVSY